MGFHFKHKSKELISNDIVEGNGFEIIEAEVGDSIFFGNYWRGKSQNERKHPIEWRVLDKRWDGRYLLISEYGIDSKPYNEKRKSITWKYCSLRKWLNSQFLNEAFNEEEKRRVVTTKITNSDSVYGTPGGEDTRDKVFLLSIDEASKYFINDDGRHQNGIQLSNNFESREFSNITKVYYSSYERTCMPTPYAVKNGAWIYSNYDCKEYYRNNCKEDCKYHGKDNWNNGRSWWRLRSPGCCSLLSSCITEDGTINGYGYSVDFTDAVIRPVIVAYFGLDDLECLCPHKYTLKKKKSNCRNQTPVFPKYEVGSIIHFGNYWQGESRDEGKTPIEWRVLENRKDGTSLVISEYGLDCQYYNGDGYGLKRADGDMDNRFVISKYEVTWATSAIRRWLNSEFINNAFTDEEKRRITRARTENDDYPGSDERIITRDKIFLLSREDISLYSPQDDVEMEFESDDRSLKYCKPTAYARKRDNGRSYPFDDKWDFLLKSSRGFDLVRPAMIIKL